MRQSEFTIPHPAHLLRLLQGSQYTPLETLLGEAQSLYEQGLITDEQLHHAFRAFDSPFSTLGQHLQEWIDQHPQSYVAHLAMGRWLLGQAWRYRGGTTSNLVSQRGRRGLLHFTEQARKAAEHSQSLTEKPLLSHLLVGQIELFFGSRLSLQDLQDRKYPEWYQKATEIDPTGVMAPSGLIRNMRIEWGGSEQHLMVFLDQQAGHRRIKQLKGQVLAALAHHQDAFLKNTQKAEELYEQAILEDPNLKPALARFLHQRTLFSSLQVIERVRALLREAFEANAHNPAFHLGACGAVVVQQQIHGTKSEDEQWFKILKGMAEGGDLDAVTLVAETLTEHPALDPEPNTHWFERAIQEGDHDASEAYTRELFRRDTLSGPERMQRILNMALSGSPYCAFVVWQHRSAFQQHLQLGSQEALSFLWRAVDAGDEKARRVLVSLIQKGQVRLEDDQWVHARQHKPTADDLAYAQHLKGIPSMASQIPPFLRFVVVTYHLLRDRKDHARMKKAFRA